MKRLITLSIIFMVVLNVNSFGQAKKVLFEQFTNASCGPCASSNPTLKAYLDEKGDSIVAIKYHTNFPGFDPMYNSNPTQVEERRGGYYSDVNAVPWLKGDGNLFPDIWPFTISNFDNAFYTRMAVTPQVLLNITDMKIPGDSIRTTISINIPSALAAGNYKLRVMVVEDVIVYPSPPGSNGESVFEHVFRKGLPSMAGTELQTAAGTYIFTFTYKIEGGWIDSNIMTAAFVQNDNGQKEVLNCNLGERIVTGIGQNNNVIPEKYSLSQNYPNPFNPSTTIKFDISSNEQVKLTVYNSLGKEIATLVNERMNAGSYERSFNASQLSSGIYFYKLEAGNFSEIKKMTLLK